MRVLASSLTLSDSIVRRGLNPYTAHLALPFTLGYDFVGTVEEVTEPACGVHVGDLVADMPRHGGNSDSLVRPAGALTRVRADVDPVVLEPLVMNGVTAYQVLHGVAGVRPGQTVLVHGGTGGVGLLLVKLAVLAGARVLATGSPAKHRALAQRGASALDGRSLSLADDVRALVPAGVDAVFDGVGGTSRVEVAMTLRQGGAFVGFGFAGPASEVAARTPEDLQHTATVTAQAAVVLQRVRNAGSRAEEYEVGSARENDRAAYDRDLGTLADLVAAGRLHPQVRPVGFDEVVSAHTAIDAGAGAGRLVLDHSRP